MSTVSEQNIRKEYQRKVNECIENLQIAVEMSFNKIDAELDKLLNDKSDKIIKSQLQIDFQNIKSNCLLNLQNDNFQKQTCKEVTSLIKNNIQNNLQKKQQQYEKKIQETQTKFEKIIQLKDNKIQELTNQQTIQQPQTLIQQYNKSLSFSNTYKHTSCSVSEGGKVVECGCSGYNFCLCEQAIPKTGTIYFALQMISGSGFMVGLGFREKMKEKDYRGCHGTGSGTYLMQHDSRTWSDLNIDGINLSFKFKANDIIIIEVCIEHNYIKWSRCNNPQQTFVLDIDTSQELYPCVGLHDSKIKLLDNVPA